MNAQRSKAPSLGKEEWQPPRLTRVVLLPRSPARLTRPRSNIMPKKVSPKLKTFLKPFPADVQKTALYLRKFVWDMLPEANELIYDNYNALVIGFSLSDRAGNVICSIATYARYCNFGFFPGTDIPDPKKLLKGGGSMYRYIRVENIENFPVEDMKKMLADARINAGAKMKGEQTLKGATMVKAISAKKRRPVL
jgi:hypothetical protein